MRSPNLSIGKHKHLNLTIKTCMESPLFLIPTFYFIPSHDVNLEIEGFAIGFCFLRTITQINVRKASWPQKNPNVDLVRANALSSKMLDGNGQGPDAMAIVNAFEKNRWLRELTSRGVEESPYGLKIIREISKEAPTKKDEPSSFRSSQPSSEFKVEGLD